MNYDKIGFLQVNTYSAGGAVPTPGINVRIQGNDDMNGSLNYSIITDRNGQSEVISLPAPLAIYSQTPNSPEQGFSTYNVEAFGEGFYPKRLFDIAIFPDIKSVLNLEMIPDAGITQNVTSPIIDNISIIQENEDLI